MFSSECQMRSISSSKHVLAFICSSVQCVCRAATAPPASSAAAVLGGLPAITSPGSALVLRDSREAAASRVSGAGSPSSRASDPGLLLQTPPSPSVSLSSRYIWPQLQPGVPVLCGQPTLPPSVWAVLLRPRLSRAQMRQK